MAVRVLAAPIPAAPAPAVAPAVATLQPRVVVPPAAAVMVTSAPAAAAVVDPVPAAVVAPGGADEGVDPPPASVVADSVVAATPAAATVASAAGAGAPVDPEDAPQCVICQESMNRGDDTMALFCGHAFHSLCVQEWRVVARKTERQCPFRCGETAAHPFFTSPWLIYLNMCFQTVCTGR